MANEKAAELTEPGIGALDDPTALVAPELATVLVASASAFLETEHKQ